MTPRTMRPGVRFGLPGIVPVRGGSVVSRPEVMHAKNFSDVPMMDRVCTAISSVEQKAESA